MKKIIYIFIALFFVVGCSDLSNTPTKKTEEFLKKYQTLDNNVITDLNAVVNDEITFSSEQKEKYKDIMKKHYQNLTYEIKEDVINGNEAIVTVEIEVTDLKKVLEDANAYLKEHPEEFNDDFGNYSLTKYTDYKLEKLKEAKEKVKYTINITLTKTNDEWRVNTASEEIMDKINGIYNY